MSKQQQYDYVGPNFVIEKNVLKGAPEEIDLTAADGVGEVVLKQLSDNPDHVAQINADSGESSTCGEMRDRMVRCALWLRERRVGKGDVITVCTENRSDSYVPSFAAFLLGAIYNPWHHEVTLKLARYLMDLTRPKVVFVCQGAVDTLAEAARLENLDPTFVVFGDHPKFDSLAEALKRPTAEEVEKFQPKPAKGRSDTSMILFSSGTTGLPKGVAISYETLLRWVVTFSKSMRYRKLVSLWYSSLYWMSGTFMMIITLMSTSTRVIHLDSRPDETSKIIEKFKVSSMFFSPTMVTHYCKSSVFKNYNLESLRFISIGGAKMSSRILHEFKSNFPNAIISQGYGMTEIGAAAATQTKDCKHDDSVGFVVPSCQIKVVDIETGRSLGPNQKGECYIKSPCQMIGYYKNPEATKSTIDEEGWVHSGDIVYYTEEGEIVVVDRIKEVMKFRGHHVSPTELEEVLSKHPGVMEVAVVPVPHEVDLERPMAFVKKVPGAEVTEEELVEMTSELGEMKKLWGGVKFLDQMPHTVSGKISRKDLKEMAKALSDCTFYS